MSDATTPAAGSLTLRYSALSDLGRYRKDNQDSGYAGDHLLVVADGVGGAAYGDVASHTAVQILRRLDEAPTGDLLEALAGTVHRVHDRLAELVEQDRELEGTSTTVTAGVFDGSRLGMAHLGDSRAYLLREGELTQVTQDHTFVQTLIDEGRITEEESRSHPHRNLILKAVDSVHETEPDLFYVDLRAGDRLLFCSDGCSGVIDDAAMTRLLGDGTVDYVTVELVRTALDNGTTDNVTVVVADVVEKSPPPSGTPQERATDDTDIHAALSTGPMLVGAAAGQPRKLGGDAPAATATSASRRTDEREHQADTLLESPEDFDPEEMRYALRPPRRFTWLRRLAVLGVLLGLVTAGGVLAYSWSQDQYYVSDDGDYVSIYRGIELELPLLELSSLEERSEVTLAALPESYAETIRDGLAFDSLERARVTVDQAYALARACPTAEQLAEEAERQERRERRAEREAEQQAEQPNTEPNPSPTDGPTDEPTGEPDPEPEPEPVLAPPDCVEKDAP